MEVRQAPAAAEALPEAKVAVPQQESAGAVVQPVAEAAVPPQEPTLAGSSQATTVEIPDDDTPPPGWDQWGSLPAGGGACQTVGWPHGGWGLEARRRGLFVPRRPPGSSGPAADPGQGQERVDAPSPLFADAQEEQQLWEELRGHGASLNRALNEALQIHDGPAWHVLQV
jgi:hypothetical protein